MPAVFAAEQLAPDRPTLLFVLSILAIVPLATLDKVRTEYERVKGFDSKVAQRIRHEFGLRAE